MARAAIREDLYAAHQLISADVLSEGDGTATPEQRYEKWEAKNATILSRARATLDEIQASETFDLANISANNSFDEVEQLRLLEIYFERAPDEATQRAFDAMKTASALREAMWGMVSELHLNVPGVDYGAHANEYLGRYERALKTFRDRYGAS